MADYKPRWKCWPWHRVFWHWRWPSQSVWLWQVHHKRRWVTISWPYFLCYCYYFSFFIHRDRVLINVVFSLEGNDRCENNVVRTVCSQYPKVTPFTFTSSGSSVVVFFVSDSSVNRRGFLLKYKSNATYTTTTVTQTTESSSSQATSSSVEKSNKGVTNLSICWHTKMFVKAMLVQLLVGFFFF